MLSVFFLSKFRGNYIVKKYNHIKIFFIFLHSILSCINLHATGTPSGEVKLHETLSSFASECFKKLSEGRMTLEGKTEQDPIFKLVKEIPPLLPYEQLKEAIRQITQKYVEALDNKDVWLDEKKPASDFFGVDKEGLPAQIPEDKQPPIAQTLFAPSGSNLILIGDIHGSVHSLVRNFIRLVLLGHIDDNFVLKKNVYLIFLGDIADRGWYSVEAWYLIMLVKLKNWDRVQILQGNHEIIAQNRHDGSHLELKLKYRNDLLKEFRANGKFVAAETFLKDASQQTRPFDPENLKKVFLGKDFKKRLENLYVAVKKNEKDPALVGSNLTAFTAWTIEYLKNPTVAKFETEPDRAAFEEWYDKYVKTDDYALRSEKSWEEKWPEYVFDYVYDNEPNSLQLLYRFLPLVLYVGSGSSPDTASYAQCCHGGIAKAFNPQALIKSDKRFQIIPTDDSANFNWGDFAIKAGNLVCSHRKDSDEKFVIEDVPAHLEAMGIKVIFRGHEDQCFGHKMIPAKERVTEIEKELDKKPLTYPNIDKKASLKEMFKYTLQVTDAYGEAYSTPDDSEDEPKKANIQTALKKAAMMAFSGQAQKYFIKYLIYWKDVVPAQYHEKPFTLGEYAPVHTSTTAIESQQVFCDFFAIVTTADTFSEWRLKPYETYLFDACKKVSWKKTLSPGVFAPLRNYVSLERGVGDTLAITFSKLPPADPFGPKLRAALGISGESVPEPSAGNAQVLLQTGLKDSLTAVKDTFGALSVALKSIVQSNKNQPPVNPEPAGKKPLPVVKIKDVVRQSLKAKIGTILTASKVALNVAITNFTLTSDEKTALSNLSSSDKTEILGGKTIQEALKKKVESSGSHDLKALINALVS